MVDYQTVIHTDKKTSTAKSVLFKPTNKFLSRVFHVLATLFFATNATWLSAD